MWWGSSESFISPNHHLAWPFGFSKNGLSPFSYRKAFVSLLNQRPRPGRTSTRIQPMVTLGCRLGQRRFPRICLRISARNGCHSLSTVPLSMNVKKLNLTDWSVSGSFDRHDIRSDCLTMKRDSSKWRSFDHFSEICSQGEQVLYILLLL